MEKETAMKILKELHGKSLFAERTALETIIPELKESEDEKVRKRLICGMNALKEQKNETFATIPIDDAIAWLEKQGNEPAWCHHKADLSDCTEEYRKAYYDGWNNCNQQHSQCDADKNDVIKCLINGMRFYYGDNKDATWGTDKWSMPVKHIIDVLEKQGSEQKPILDFKARNWYVSKVDGKIHDMTYNPTDKVEPKVGEKIEDEIEIPFGAMDSELQEETYYIPKGFHAEIDDDKVIIKKGEKLTAWSDEDENYLQSAENACEYQYGKNTSTILWLKSLKDRIGG